MQFNKWLAGAGLATALLAIAPPSPAASPPKPIGGIAAAPEAVQSRPVEATAQPFADDRCFVDLPTLTGNLTFSHARMAIAERHELRIVALGSSSTQGYGSSSPTRAYPAQLADLLSDALPDVRVSVVNKGVGGEDSTEMLRRFARDIRPGSTDLVIWQVGTNAALQEVPLDLFHANLKSGFAALRGFGVDGLAMNQQYSPRFFKVPTHRDYVEAMHEEAEAAGIPTFERYAASQVWYSSPGFVETPAVTPDGLHQSDAGYRCDAFLLARDLVHAFGTTRTALTPPATLTP